MSYCTKTASTSSSNQNANLSDFNQQALKGVLAGAFAGAVSKTTVAPMERVKLCLQLQPAIAAGTSSSALSLPLSASSACTEAAAASSPAAYRGIVDCARRLCADEGVRSLWRGNSAAVLRCLPHNVLNLLLRDRFRVALLEGVERRAQPLRFVAGNIAAGGAGAAVSLVFCYPLDLARTRLAVEGGAHRARFHGVAHCLAEVHAGEGVRGLWRGLGASMVHTILSRALFFGIFDSVRLARAEERGAALSFASTWTLAQASIVVSSFACYPLDTVRRRLMLEAGAARRRYRSQWHCLTTVVREEGARVLYNGALSNSLRCTSGALILAIYYELLKYI